MLQHVLHGLVPVHVYICMVVELPDILSLQIKMQDVLLPLSDSEYGTKHLLL